MTDPASSTAPSSSPSPTPSPGRRVFLALRRIYLLPVRAYQVTLARWLGGHCRYQPTCSRYFIDAVMKRGIVIGTAKGVWRICRCHPWSKGGWDPVE